VKILVTGASGFIGRRLVARLAKEHEVWALGYRHVGPPQAGVRWISHDLSHGTVPPGLPTQADVVVHLAQSRHYREFPSHADDNVSIGVTATFRLLEWARAADVSRFVYASTGGLYGLRDEPVKEGDPLVEEPGPLGFYFAVKRAGELLTAQYRRCFETTILRLFFVYGAGQDAGRLMPRLVEAVRDGRPIILQGEQGMRFNPVHVTDVVEALTRCLRLRGSQVVNVAGPTVLSLRRVGELIGQCVGHLPVFTTDGAAASCDLVADIARMEALLGRPAVQPRQGIEDLCASPAPSAACARNVGR
jgi:nucleoside-diphosphate-sugar epimerase